MTELDPKPWATEPNAVDVRTFRSAKRSLTFRVFSPREGYEQDRAKYPKPSRRCFYPRSPSILCDRTDRHSGRHAAYNDNGKRVYWSD